MGKLRDWWPSDEMVEQIRSSSSNSAAATSSRSGGASAQVNSASATLSAVKTLAVGPTAAATLRLSEVAAALNAMPNHPPNSVASTPNAEVGGSTSSPLSNLSPTKPAAIRLTNTQAHKEELLKKVLSRSESSTDLQMCLPQKTHTPSSLPSSPVHTIASPVRTSNAQQPRKSSFTSIIERGMQRKAEAANKPFTNAIPTEDAADLQKRKRDTSLTLKRSTVVTSPDTEDNVQTPATPAATPELSTGMQKETLTRREIHIFSERQRRKGMTHLYTILHSLLPDAKPKTDRCTVLTEAMDYIHELQMRLNELGTQKNEILESIAEQLQMDSSNLTGSRMQGGVENVGRNFDDLITEEMREEILAAADVVVRFCGRDAFITLNSPRRNGVWSAILHVLHEQDMDLLNVTLSTSNDMDYHCIHAKSCKVRHTFCVKLWAVEKLTQDCGPLRSNLSAQPRLICTFSPLCKMSKGLILEVFMYDTKSPSQSLQVLNAELHSNELQRMLQEVVLNHAVLD